jgi:class 3 adenylate cyclase/tetratricopeptide (TPR) repeat protein
MTCPACHRATLAAWRYCPSCGEPLRIATGPEQGHHVTVVVSDLQGSTALAERLDPESLRAVLDRYFDELGAVLESHGGRIEKRIGDAMVTVFGLPAPRADDAERALRAVAECQGTLASLNDRLERTWGVRLTNRSGVATGAVTLVDAGGGHRVLAGTAVDRAMQLEPVAPPLEALVDETTLAEVGERARAEPLDDVTLRSGAVARAARLVSVTDTDEAVERAVPDATQCTTCGADLDVAADPPWAWCPKCASPLVIGARRRESRRTLTIVFGDLRPAPSHDGDAGAVHRATVEAFEGLRAVLERHGATVEKFIGDAVMAVFGLERRQEDDAVRAVRAAVQMHQHLTDHPTAVPLELRIGVNTGPVIAGDPRLGQRLVTGDAVNVAARLEQTSAPGQVVIGPLTRRLIGSSADLTELEPLTLKGKSEPVPAFRVDSIASGAASFARLELPLVGRDAELAHLVEAFEHVASSSSFRRIDIVGDVGLGKSRLVHELLDQVGGRAITLRGTCLSYGEGITFWPVAEIIQAAAGTSAGDEPALARAAIGQLAGDPFVADRLGSILGLVDEPYPVGELFFAVRRMLEALAHHTPVVLVVDGLHWAEPTLLDLLDSLSEHLSESPLLLLTMRRPDGVGPVPSAALELAALADDDALRLVSAVVGEGALPAAIVDRVAEAAAGNPLFIEQFLTMLVDEGLIASRRERWVVVGDLASVAVPPTVEAVLAARIDALDEPERRVIEPASVVGREFPQAAVDALADEPTDSTAALDALARRQLVGPVRDPEPLVDHRFRSLLLRDVVYGSLLKRTRAELHERLADWLESFPPVAARITEHEEILGYHLEQAHLLRGQLEALDAAGVTLGRRAAAHLERAGERAYRRGDMPAAANLLARAARTLPDADPARPSLLVRAGSARMETGAFAEAAQLFDEAERRAGALDDDVGVASAELARTTMRYLTGDGVSDVAARDIAERTATVFRSAGDHGGLARCFNLLAYVEATHCQWGATEQAATQVIEHARAAGDAVLERRLLPALASSLLHGPTPVPEAIERCRALLGATAADRRGQALTERSLAGLLAMDDRIGDARRLCEDARRSLEELGWHFDASLVGLELGPAELLAGRPDLAEAVLRADYEALDAMGEQNYISTIGAWLAEAVRRQGRNDEATELIDRSAEVATDDDVISQALIRSVRSKVAAHRGDLVTADRLADEAIALLRDTDELAALGDALVDRADVLALSGRAAAAIAIAEEGAAVLREKAARPLERRALAVLERLRSGAAEVTPPTTG